MAVSRIPDDVSDAVYRLVKAYGAERLSAKTGTPAGTIYNKANPNDSSHHKPTLSDVLIWTQITGDYQVVRALCHSLDGVFVPLHTQQHASDLELLDLLLARDVRHGQFADSLATAISDGRVSEKEFRDLRSRGMDVVTSMLELLGRLEGMIDG